MVIIGSKALQIRLGNIGRVIHDIDIWMPDNQYESFVKQYKNYIIKETESVTLAEIRKGQILEIKPYSKLWKTDKEIYDRTVKYQGHTYGFGFGHESLGLGAIPSIEDLFIMKATTVPFVDEPKHKHDLALFPENLIIDAEFLSRRLNETREYWDKIKKVKYDFFHKYEIPEYIVHDDLHVIIADLLDIGLPTYQRITTAETDIGQELFEKLTFDQKINLMVEESLVLALERWFIPQMIENGINYKLVDNFYINNEGFATYNILRHCCITGLKGEADYIVNFSRINFFEIEKKWQEAKLKIKEKGGFPKDFYNQLFNLRDRYKKGEKVQII